MKVFIVFRRNNITKTFNDIADRKDNDDYHHRTILREVRKCLVKHKFIIRCSFESHNKMNHVSTPTSSKSIDN